MGYSITVAICILSGTSVAVPVEFISFVNDTRVWIREAQQEGMVLYHHPVISFLSLPLLVGSFGARISKFTVAARVI